MTNTIKGYILMMSVLLMLFIFSVIHENNLVDKKYKEYVWVVDSTYISSRIVHKSIFRGTGNWIMSDKQKYSYGLATNHKYRPPSLPEFCQRGDSVYKSSGSMFIYIIRDDSVYSFVIGKTLY